MTTPNPENYEDIAISEKIEENRCIEQLGYDRFIRLCIQFTREAVLHHDTKTPAADLQHALDFWWCPKKYADIKRQANNGISIVQNFLLKQRNLANLNY